MNNRKTTTILILFFLILFAFRSEAWWNYSWKYRTMVQFSNSTSDTLTNERVFVSLRSADSSFWENINVNGSDIRFIDSDSQNQDTYWIESLNIADRTGLIFLEIPQILPNDTATAYLYYGNSSASAASDTILSFQIVGEVGTVVTDENYLSAAYRKSYAKTPIVFAGLTTWNEVDFIAIRLKNISDTGFDVAVEEAADDDGNHALETVGWLAIMPGQYTIGGKLVDVDTMVTSNTYNSHSFTQSFSAVPSIIAQIQSYNESDSASHLRGSNATSSGVDINIEEEVNSNSHANEDIGVFAIESGVANSGYTGGYLIQSGQTGASVTGNWFNQSFGTAFSDSYMLFTWQFTENGGASSNTRTRNLYLSDFDVRIDETLTYDGPGGAHASENVAWLAIDSGAYIYAYSTDTTGLLSGQVAASDSFTIQPDCKIRNQADAEFTGADIFNVTGDNQTKGQSVNLTDTAIFVIEIENISRITNGTDIIDSFTVTGDTEITNWTVNYFDSITAGNDITDSVTGSGWITADLNYGETIIIRLEVTPKSSASGGENLIISCTSVSQIDTTAVDKVRSITTVSSAIQPDGQIKNSGDASFIGDNIYNTTAIGQFKEQTISSGETAVFTFYFENDGNLSDSFSIKGDTLTNGFCIFYYDDISSGTDISESVTSTGFNTANLNSGQAKTFRLEVIISDTTVLTGGDSLYIYISGTSNTNDTSSDTICAKTVFMPVYTPDIKIAGADLSFSGDTVYNTTGDSQTKSLEIYNVDSGTFIIEVENDGNLPDSFIITATGSNNDFDVLYFNNVTGGNDITSFVTGSGYETGILNIGDTVWIRGEAAVTSAAIYDSITIVIQSKSSNDNSKDVAKCYVTRISPSSGSSNDLLIKEENVTTYTGNNIYNLTGSNQFSAKGVAAGDTVKFHIKLENDGVQADTFTLYADTGISVDWNVYFYDALTGGSDITAGITGSGYSPGLLGKDEVTYIRVELSPSANVTAGSINRLYVTVISDVDTSFRDAVKIESYKIVPETIDWWDTNWKYRKKIEITNNESDQSLINYQVKIVISSSDTNFWAKVKSDGTDIRLIDANQTDTVPFWIETFNYAGEAADIWCMLDGVDNNGTTAIYLYYGNSSATGTSDSGLTKTYIRVGESGYYYPLHEVWVQESYRTTYSETPQVFINDNSYGGSNESAYRVRYCTQSGFQLCVMEYPSLDGSHPGNDLVPRLVLMPGKWIIGGKYWVVGQERTDHTFRTFDFGYTFAEEPIVNSQIHSYYQAETPGQDNSHAGSHTRMKNRTTSSIQCKIEMEIDLTHINEFISFYAVEAGPVNQTYTNNVLIENGSVTAEGNWGSVTFSSTFSNPPNVVGRMMTEDDPQNADIRMDNPTTTGCDIYVENVGNLPNAHGNELLSWTAIDSGVAIYGRKFTENAPTVTETKTEHLNILPDLSAEEGQTYIGNDNYDTDAGAQSKGESIQSGDSATFYIRIQNDGSIANLVGGNINLTDTFSITTDTGNSNWTVQCFDAKTGGSDITDQIVSSGWTTPGLAYGDSVIIRISIFSAAGLNGGDQFSIDLYCTSTVNPYVYDRFSCISSIVSNAQKDLLIRNAGDVNFSGNDLYDTTGINQFKSQSVSNNNTVEYELIIENDGNVADTVIIYGTSGNSDWVVKYYNLLDGGLEITDDVTSANGDSIINMSPGDTSPMRVEVTPLSNPQGGDTFHVFVTVISDSENSIGDTAILKTTVSFLPQPDGMIKEQNKTDYQGDNTYNISGANQTDSKTVSPGGLAVFYIIIENDGNFTDTINITGDTGITGYILTYYDAFTGGVDITNQVTSTSGWDTGESAIGETITLRLEVQTLSSVLSGDTAGFKIIMVSEADNTKKDIIFANIYIPEYRLDMQVKNSGDASYTGGNVYNTNGSLQKKIQSTSTNAKFYIKIENDGNAEDTYIITGDTGSGNWMVLYYDALTGGNDITSDVTGSGWQVYIAPNGYSEIRTVINGSNAAENSSCTVFIEGYSNSDTSQIDSLKIETGKPAVESNIWWDTNYAKRKKVIIDNSGNSAITNYQVKLTLTTADSGFFDSIENNGKDVRILAANNSDTLSYWYESLNIPDSSAEIWTKIPVVTENDTTAVYIYYDYPSAVMDSSFVKVYNAIGEVGKTSASINESFTTVSFANNYSETPIVFADGATINAADEMSLRLRNITTSGFDAATMEYPSNDGTHASEIISYLAILPGNWIIGGQEAVIGMSQNNENFITVNFSHTFDAAPVVISDIQSYYLTETSGSSQSAGTHTRMKLLSVSSIKIKLENEGDINHAREYVGFMAIANGSISQTYTNGYQFEVAKTSADNNSTPISLLNTYSAAPGVLTTIEEEDDPANANLRISGITTTGYNMYIENVAGIANLHLNENISYFAGDSGAIIYARKFVENPPSISISSPIYASRPDIQFAITAGNYSGNDSFSVIGTDQTLEKNTVYLDTSIFYIKIENDGMITDSFTIYGDTGNSNFITAYYDAESGGAEITNSVTGSGWTSGNTAIGDSLVIRIEVYQNFGSVSVGDSIYLFAGAVSNAHSQFSDSGRLKVNVVNGVASGTTTTITAITPVGINGIDSAEVTVTVLNSDGVPIPGETVTISSDRGSDTVIQPSALTNNNGIATGYVYGNVEGTSVINIDSPAVATDTATIYFYTKNVVINELAYQPSSGDNGSGEWLELFNITDTPVEIGNWIIDDGEGQYTIAAGETIPAYGFFLLEYSENAVDTNADAVYGAAAPSLLLSNSGENIKLKNSSGNVIDEITYSSSWGGGNSLERINPYDSENDDNNWDTSMVSGGSPRLINTNRVSSTTLTVLKDNALPDNTDTIQILITTKGKDNAIVSEGVNFYAASSRSGYDNITNPSTTNSQGTTTFIVTSTTSGTSVISIDTPAGVTDSITVTFTNYITIDTMPLNISPLTLSPGDKDTVVLKFLITDNLTPDTLTSVSVTNIYHTSSTIQDISAVKCYIDTDGNNSLDTTIDMLFGTAQSFSDVNTDTVIFYDSYAFSGSSDSKSVFITVSINNSSVTDNDYIDMKIETGKLTFAGRTGNLPLSAVNSPDSRQIEVTATAITLSPESETVSVGIGHTITATAVDSNGNLDIDNSINATFIINGDTAYFTSTNLNNQIPGALTNSDSRVTGNFVQGEAAVSLKDSEEETVTVTVSSSLLDDTVTVIFSQDASVTVNPLTASGAKPGIENHIVLDINISNPSQSNDIIDTIILTGENTYNTNVLLVKLWIDQNKDGIVQQGIDTYHDSGTFSSDTIIFNDTFGEGASGVRVLFTFDIDTYPITDNAKIGARIDTNMVTLNIAGDIGTTEIDSISNDNNNEYVNVNVADASQNGDILFTPATNEAMVGDNPVKTLKVLDQYQNIDVNFTDTNITITDTNNVITIVSTSMNVVAGLGSSTLIAKMTNDGDGIDTIAISSSDSGTFTLSAFVDSPPPDTGTILQTYISIVPLIGITYPSDNLDTKIKDISVSGTSDNSVTGDSIGIYLNNIWQGTTTILTDNGNWNGTASLTGIGDTINVYIINISSVVRVDTLIINYFDSPTIEITYPSPQDTKTASITVSGTSENTDIGDTIRIYVDNVINDTYTLTSINSSFSGTAFLNGYNDSLVACIRDKFGREFYDTVHINYTAVPATVNLVSPDDKTDTFYKKPFFVWDVPSDTNNDSLYFIIQISSDDTFSNIVDSGNSFLDTTNFLWYHAGSWDSYPDTGGVIAGNDSAGFIPYNNITGDTHYWRVVAFDSYTTGGTSAIWEWNPVPKIQPTNSMDTITLNGSLYQDTGLIPGVTIFVTINASNIGSDTANNVLIRFPIPDNTIFSDTYIVDSECTVEWSTLPSPNQTYNSGDYSTTLPSPAYTIKWIRFKKDALLYGNSIYNVIKLIVK